MTFSVSIPYNKFFSSIPCTVFLWCTSNTDYQLLITKMRFLQFDNYHGICTAFHLGVIKCWDYILQCWHSTSIIIIVETLFAVKGVSFNFSEHKKVLLNPSLAIITNAMSFFKIYLHCTVILTASTALPHSLLASHLYSPASLLLMLVNSSTLLLVRWPLATLIQNTVGWGVPDALQNRLVLWLSIKNWSSIDWMDAGTAIKLHKLLLCLAQKSKHFQGFCLKFKDFSRSGSNHENCKHYSSMHCASDQPTDTPHAPQECEF